MPKLSHLVLVPKGGLGNRLRAIAAGRRLCAQIGARLTIYWDWGFCHDFFTDDDMTHFVTSVPAEMFYAWKMKTKMMAEGGNATNRRVPTEEFDTLVVETCHCFCGENDLKPVYEQDLGSWYPQPAATICRRVEAFYSNHLGRRGCVGMHLRRSDNRVACCMSPDAVFLEEARRIVANGRLIFVASNDLSREALLQRKFGASVIRYPKDSSILVRWPRPSVTALELLDDYVDLLLLAACDYVLGCCGSSFSRTAMVMNGSVLSRELVIGMDNEE